MLAALLLHPTREYTVAELARQIGVSASTLHPDVDRLVTAGLLRDRRIGRARLLSANPESRLSGPLTDLVALTYGPLTVVGDEFGPLDSADLVLIYGSWAARYSGEPGPLPNDVDVLVVGSPVRRAVYDAAERAGRKLGLPVNVTISSPERWAAAADALVQQIKASPSVRVVDRPGVAREGRS